MPHSSLDRLLWDWYERTRVLFILLGRLLEPAAWDRVHRQGYIRKRFARVGVQPVAMEVDFQWSAQDACVDRAILHVLAVFTAVARPIVDSAPLPFVRRCGCPPRPGDRIIVISEVAQGIGAAAADAPATCRGLGVLQPALSNLARSGTK